MAKVQVEGLSYTYQVGGLSEISFTVPEGKIACLLGPSGSGKTTLLKLIAGFLKPQQGLITFDQKTIADAQGVFVTPQKRKVGLVFQQHALFPHLTIAKNILFGSSEKDSQKKKILLQKLLKDFQIEQHEDRFPHQISGGEQQRVAIARALASAPEILLMDEPFSSLDSDLRSHIQQQCLQVIRDRQMTTLIVTHDEQSTKNLADVLIRLPKPLIAAPEA